MAEDGPADPGAALTLALYLLLALPQIAGAQVRSISTSDTMALRSVEQLTTPAEADKYPAGVYDRTGRLWLAWTATRDGRDVIMVRSHEDGRWSDEKRLDSGEGFESRPQLALDHNGDLWAVWHGRRGSQWSVRARSFADGVWGPERTLSDAEDQALHPVITRDRSGRVWLAYEVTEPAGFELRVRSLSPNGWSSPAAIASDGLDRRPAIAADGRSGVWIAWHSTRSGDYEIFLARIRYRSAAAPSVDSIVQVTHHPAFDDMPSLAALPNGDVWIAWNSTRSHADAATIAEQRGGDAFVRVLRNGQLLAPPGVVAKAEAGQVSFGAVDKSANDVEPAAWHWKQTQNYPTVFADSAQRVWIIWRTDATGGHNFDLWARVHANDAWSPELHLTGFSPGRDEWPAVVASADGVTRLLWEGQAVPVPGEEAKYAGGFVDLYDTRGQPNVVLTGVLVPPAHGWHPAPLRAAPHEAEATAPSKAAADGPAPRVGRYRVYFGDLHSHTIYSDAKTGLPDQLYWLAREGEGLDFFALTDHAEMGVLQPTEYAENVLTAQLFDEPGRFVGLVGWEWTAPPSFGHRIVIAGHDSILPLSSAAPDGDSIQELYAHLRGTGSIISPHHTGQASWGRWNPDAPHDPLIEPLFEIASWHGRFEYYGNPHEGRRQVPGHHFVDALARDRHVGVLGSSDAHFLNVGDGGLTAVLGERLDRASLFDALRARRTYATTGAKLLLDFTANGAPIGSRIVADQVVKLRVAVTGTAPIDRIEIVRDSKDTWAVVRLQQDPESGSATFMMYDPAAPQAGTRMRVDDAGVIEFEVEDAAADEETSYYVRVTQADGQQAWSSPIWVR